MFVPIAPLSKPRMTRRDRFAPRLCVRKYWLYKRDIHPYKTDLSLQPMKVTFFLAMPESWTDKKKADHDGQFHRVKPDVDNLLKGLMDAWMTKDQTVASIVVEKRWAYQAGIMVNPLDQD